MMMMMNIQPVNRLYWLTCVTIYLGLLTTIDANHTQLSKEVNKLLLIQCDSSLAFPKSVQIADCERDIGHYHVCPMHNGKNYSMQIQFETNTNKNVQKVYLQTLVLAGKTSFELPFFGKKDFCRINNGFDCPLKSNQTYVQKLEFRLPKHIPNIQAIVQVKLLAQNKKPFLCFKLPLSIHNYK